MGLAHEGWLQGLVLDRENFVTALNYIYIFGHWPAIAVSFIWLALRAPGVLTRARNAMLASGAVGLVVFVLIPVAPPRLAGLGLTDTVTQYSQAYRILQPPALTNQYAALPSLHVGWNLLVGLAVFTAARVWWLRTIAVLSPILALPV